MPHEHLLIDSTRLLVEPNRFSKMPLVDAPVSIEILADLKRDIMISNDNLRLDDLNDAIAELTRYKMFGGSSIVDVTVPGIGRDPLAIRAISTATDVNVVCATGWYVDRTHPAYVKSKSVDELAAIMMRELREGIDETGIRAGVIKIAFGGDPFTKNEKKVLEAAAQVQAETGAPVDIHPAQYNIEKRVFSKTAGEYLNLMREERADLSKVYISHMEYTSSDLEYQKTLIDEYGVTLAYDCFGQEYYSDSSSLGKGGFSDKQRVEALVKLLNAGHEKHLMVSNDICYKVKLRKYGGYGYANILEHIVPMLKFEGIIQKQINAMLVENPKRILSW